jgi:iduronate 2-sulfatase
MLRCLLAVSALVSLLSATGAGRPNVLLLCIDDLRPDLRCYGAEHIRSPHIDRLAGQGVLFHRHYVQAPTCGASRFALLTGTYDRKRRGNEALFQRAASLQEPPPQPSLPRHFRDHGYTTVSIGKVSHHPGGRGGPDWDDATKPEMPGDWDRHLQPVDAWQHPRGVMHGLAHGEIRVKAGNMAVYQAVDGADDIYPDGLTTDAALREMDVLKAAGKPFFLAVGIIRPHLPFGAPKRYLDLYQDTALPPIPHPDKPAGRTTWHGSGEFMGYQRWGRDPRNDATFADAVRRHYAACVSYADAQVGRILDRLTALGLAGDTIVVLWGDHGWHLGEHAVWGKHTLFEESMRSPLIIRHPGMAKTGTQTKRITQTIDVYPTLCDLAGLPAPGFLDGESLVATLNDPSRADGLALGYHGKAITVRTPDHRLVLHADGFTELYDHRTPAAETANVAADQPATVRQLRGEIEKRLK